MDQHQILPLVGANLLPHVNNFYIQSFSQNFNLPVYVPSFFDSLECCRKERDSQILNLLFSSSLGFTSLGESLGGTNLTSTESELEIDNSLGKAWKFSTKLAHSVNYTQVNWTPEYPEMALQLTVIHFTP